MTNQKHIKRISCLLLCGLLAFGATFAGSYAAVSGMADALVPAEAVELVSQLMQETVTSAEMGVVEAEQGTFDLKTGERVFFATVTRKGSLWRNADKTGGTSGNLALDQRILVLEHPQDGMYQVVSSLSGNKPYGWFPEDRLARIDLGQDAEAAKDFDVMTKLAGYGFLDGGTRFEGPEGQALTLLRIAPSTRNVKAWRDLERNSVDVYAFEAGEFVLAAETTVPDRAEMFSLDGKSLGFSSVGKLDQEGRPKLYWVTEGEGFDAQIEALLAEGYTRFDPEKEARALAEAQAAIDGYVAQHTDPLNDEITGLKMQVEDRDVRLADMQKQLEAKQAEYDDLLANLELLSDENIKLTEQVDSLTAQSEALTESLAQANKDGEAAAARIAELEAALAEALQAAEAPTTEEPTKAD